MSTAAQGEGAAPAGPGGGAGAVTEPGESGAGHRRLNAMPAVTCSAWLGHWRFDWIEVTAFVLAMLVLALFAVMISDWLEEARGFEAQRREEARKRTELKKLQETPSDTK